MNSLKTFKTFFVDKLQTIDDKVRYFTLMIYVIGFIKLEVLRDKAEKMVYEVDDKMRD